MNQQKLKWIIPGAVLGLGVLWWGLSAYASSKAEDSLRQTLTRYSLQNHVHWKKVSASVFGNVKLTDVTVDIPGQGRLQADSVRLSDVIDKRDRQRVTLEVRELEDAQPEKTSFLLGSLVGAPTGMPILPPMNIKLEVDLDYADDTAMLALELQQDGGFDLLHEMELTRIGVLRDLVSAGSLPTEGRGGWGMGGFGLFGALSSLSAISLNELEMEITDHGAVKRGVTLYKRHNTTVSYENGSLESQRKEAFKAAIAGMKETCMRDRVMRVTNDVEQTCQAITRFMSGNQRSIKLKMHPDAPVSVEQLMSLYIGRSNTSVAAMLNASVD